MSDHGYNYLARDVEASIAWCRRMGTAEHLEAANLLEYDFQHSAGTILADDITRALRDSDRPLYLALGSIASEVCMREGTIR